MSAVTDPYTYLHVPAFFLIFILNVAEICVIIKRRSSMRMYEKILLNLAFSDLFIAISIALHIIGKMAEIKTLTSVCVYTNLLANVSTDGFLLLISADRLVAILFPFRHLTFPSETQVSIAVAFIWFAGAVSVPSLYYQNYLNNRTQLDLHQFARTNKIPIVCFQAVICGILILIYTCISFAMARRRQQTARQEDGANDQAVTAAAAREKAVCITSAIVVGAFIICTAPFTVTVLFFGKFSRVSSTFLFINSALNPLIYFFKSYMERRGTQRRSVKSQNRVSST